uniref:Uncharacterized protein n=1 Tax=Acrobeloides nanus TaxID=290746 RepID=A0A914CVD2_9BILA
MEALKVYLRKVLKFLIEDDVGKKFFANSTAEIERRIESFVKVETAVAEIQNNTDKHYDNVYAGDKIVTVHELQNNISKTINWSRYFAHIFPEEVLAAVGDLSKMEVHVSIIEAIEKLEALSRNLPGQVFADFLQWRIILNYVGFLDDRFIDARFELDQFLQGAQKRSARWYECKSSVETVFSPILDAIYLQVLGVHVGYMDNLFNSTKWQKYYKDLYLNSTMNFPEMAKIATAWSFQENLLQLLEPIEIEFSGFIVNGFYYALRNSIVITAGLLQGAFFNTSFPRALNYGSLGNVIGHEITHGFDNNGRLHDGEGRVRDWWNNETEA